MSKNYMKEVANLLGVELGEEFEIKGFKDYVYRFGVDYLFAKANGRNEWFEPNLLEELLNGTYEIEKSILDQKEKEYLSAVIKPFKDRDIIFIKFACGRECEFIHIGVRSEYFGGEKIQLPKFIKGTMYKSMELDKEYTLEELGL